MLSNHEFRKYGHQIIEIIADYLEHIEEHPVLSNAKPGDIKNKIGDAPVQAELFDDIIQDTEQIIIPGLTHWQHPGFMALFPSNASYESILGEVFSAGFGINAMIWDTSPAATELEEKMMNWLRDICGLPNYFQGVIQDTASTATLSAIISAREKASNFSINENGFNHFNDLIMYCSDQTHYSIAKGAKVAGIGKKNVIKIKTGDAFAMDVFELEKQIKNDIAENKKPFMVVVALGTTNTCAFDDMHAIGKICAQYDLWLHVDAAYAGSVFILPEYRNYLQGIEFADSYVFNAHKWLFTNFDCSVYFVKDARHLINTFSSNPEYLKVEDNSEIKNYKDWGIPLGRRFRALKLWFVMRSFGVEGLQNKIRYHIRLATIFYDLIKNNPDWEIMAPFQLNVLCIRYHPLAITDENELNRINESLIKRINATGKFYLSGTKLRGKYVIRIVIGQTNVEERHVMELYALINQLAAP